jgi:hypothetical protein
LYFPGIIWYARPFPVMKVYFLLPFFLLASTHLLAQSFKDTYRVQGDNDLTKVIPAKERFLLENFRKGTVYFKSGKKTEATLNYSFPHSEILFISAKNDTLRLADNDLISRIVIDDLMFYYWHNQGHLLEVGNFNKVRLTKRQELIVSDTDNYSGYGRIFSDGNITSYSTVENLKGYYQPLKTAGVVYLKKATSYFLMDQNDRFRPASKANLIKIFRRHRKEIDRYLAENSVSFSNEQDLIKLLEYSQSL